jgi:hypothetical protein
MSPQYTGGRPCPLTDEHFAMCANTEELCSYALQIIGQLEQAGLPLPAPKADFERKLALARGIRSSFGPHRP